MPLLKTVPKAEGDFAVVTVIPGPAPILLLPAHLDSTQPAAPAFVPGGVPGVVLPLAKVGGFGGATATPRSEKEKQDP
jgi:hypothetical protein